VYLVALQPDAQFNSEGFWSNGDITAIPAHIFFAWLVCIKQSQ
jgi:hypothetical protein